MASLGMLPRASLGPALALAALLLCACGEETGETGAGGAGGSTHGSGGCGGIWGGAQPVLSLAGGQSLRGGPAIAFGGLILFFVALDGGGNALTFYRAVRSSTQEAFGVPEPIPELATLCGAGEPHGIDVSEDALRAYVSCHDGTSSRSVHVASRGGTAAPFAAEGTVASQSAPPTVYGAARVSLDERTLYVSGTAADGPPMMASRNAVGEPFGTFATIDGLQDVALLYPAPSPDGLVLVGATTIDGVDTLAYVTRPDLASAYGPLTYLFAGAGYTSVPEVSADCRALYVGTSATVFALSR